MGGIVENSSKANLSSAAQFAKDRFAQLMWLLSPRFKSRYADEFRLLNRLPCNKFNPALIYNKTISLKFCQLLHKKVAWEISGKVSGLIICTIITGKELFF